MITAKAIAEMIMALASAGQTADEAIAEASAQLELLTAVKDVYAVHEPASKKKKRRKRRTKGELAEGAGHHQPIGNIMPSRNDIKPKAKAKSANKFPAVNHETGKALEPATASV